MTGWLCPKCNTSNAPWQPSCAGCAPKHDRTAILTQGARDTAWDIVERNMLRVVVDAYSDRNIARIKYFIEHARPDHVLAIIEEWEKTK